MKSRKCLWIVSLLVIASLLLAACAPAPAAPAAPAESEKEIVKETVVVEVESTKIVVVDKEVVVTPTAGPNPEAVIEGVEEGAEITFWTYYLSPTFDEYIKSTIARFEETYPGVKVTWEDHQGTFLDDYRNAFAAGNAPDVANLSDTEGWVREFAAKDLLLNMSDSLPQEVIDQYYPGLFNLQLVDGKSFQAPWYQAIAIELINTDLYVNKAGLKVEEFPKTFEELPALCKTLKEKTGKLCTIRLTVTDILRDMAYQGGVKVMDDSGKFTFDSPEAVEWLQMYVDMVKAGTVDRQVLVTDQDRVGLEAFTAGNSPFYQTGPQLIREVRANNPGLYGYLAAVPVPMGKSGVTGPTSMALSVKKDTKYPNASMALAVFFSNPRSMLEFSKIVGVYPSTPASYQDPFFTTNPVAIEESVRPMAEEIISKQADIMPEIPMAKDVNEIVRQAVEQALFNGADPQKVLTEAVAEANELISK